MSVPPTEIRAVSLEDAADALSSFAIFALAPDGTVAVWNEGCVRLFDTDTTDALGTPYGSLVVDGDRVPSLLGATRRVGRLTTQQRCPADGDRQRRVQTELVALGDGDDIIGFLGIATPIDEGASPENAARAPDEIGVQALVRWLIGAMLIDRSPAAVERTVCERLATSSFYTGAWIDDGAPADDQFEPRTWASTDKERLLSVNDGLRRAVTDALADDIVTVLGSDGGGSGAGRSAIDGPTPKRVRRTAQTPHGHRQIVLPVAASGVVHSVLVARTDRSAAFEARECTALATLADTLGQRVTSLVQEHLLFARSTTELTFTGTPSTTLLGSLATACDCQCRARIVSGEPRGPVQSITIEDGITECVRDVLGTDDRATNVSFEGTGSATVTVAVSADDLLARILALGAVVKTATATPASSRLVVETTQENAERVYDAMERWVPDWTLVRKQTRDRQAPLTETQIDHLGVDLTEKQYEVLRTAYESGYFSHPREATATDIAATLDISDTTLFQHLQAAHRKLLAAWFDDSA